MRSILLVVCGLLLATMSAPSFVFAQPAARPPTTAAAPVPQPANPGTAPLFTKHTNFGVDCITCHDEEPAAKPVPMAVCLSCHGSYDDLADKNEDMGENNPHASHNGQLECNNCHHVHQPSVNFCGQCHTFDMEVP